MPVRAIGHLGEFEEIGEVGRLGIDQVALIVLEFLPAYALAIEVIPAERVVPLLDESLLESQVERERLRAHGVELE